MRKPGQGEDQRPAKETGCCGGEEEGVGWAGILTGRLKAREGHAELEKDGGGRPSEEGGVRVGRKEGGEAGHNETKECLGFTALLA
jgi:hypothetical protein